MTQKTPSPPPEWGLTPYEAKIARALYRRRVVNRNALFRSLYKREPSPNDPLLYSLRQIVYRLRKKLKEKTGIKIESHGMGEGWYLSPEDHDKFMMMLSEEEEV